MDDPVVAADGHTYNRADIEKWFKQHDTSPHTNELFASKALFPNIAIRKQVMAWREEHGLPPILFGQPVEARTQDGRASSAAGGDAAILKPAAVCAFSKKPLQGFCITCKKAICIHCAMDQSRCQAHDIHPLESIVCGLQDTHALWVLLQQWRPKQLRAECDRVSAAANSTIEEFTRKVRTEEEQLKRVLESSLVRGIDLTITQQVNVLPGSSSPATKKLHYSLQARLLADVEIAAASPDAAAVDSEASLCLLTALTKPPRPPGQKDMGGKFVELSDQGCLLGKIVFGADIFPHILADAFKNLLAVAVETGYDFPRAKQIKEVLKNPGAFAAAPAAAAAAAAAPAAGKATAKAPLPEPEPEEEASAFSLFD